MSSPLIALIPLRAGSKGLPGKNTRPLAGRPLYTHTLEQARAAGIGVSLVSTDIAELLDADLGPDVRVVARPAALAGDATSMDAVLRHVLANDLVGAWTVVLLQATSPMRAPADIRRAIALHASGNFNLVLSAARADSCVLKWGCAEGARFVPLSKVEHCFSNRASLPPVYRPDGAVYVFDADWFRNTGTLASSPIGMIETPINRAIDIDTLADFKDVEARLVDQETSQP